MRGSSSWKNAERAAFNAYRGRISIRVVLYCHSSEGLSSIMVRTLRAISARREMRSGAACGGTFGMF